jgi:hypothetical protein
VTQVAEVAVNSAPSKPQLSPFREATGNDSRIVPIRIIPKNTKAMVCAGSSLGIIFLDADPFFPKNIPCTPFFPMATLLRLPYIIPNLPIFARVFSLFIG